MMESLKKTGIIPVVVLEDENDALPLAEALIKGGLPCAEVTFRTDAAPAALKRMTEQFPEMTETGGYCHCQWCEVYCISRAESEDRSVCAESGCFDAAGRMHTKRGGNGTVTWPEYDEILSGGSLWRCTHIKSTGRSVQACAFHAYRWYQPG